MSNIFSLLKEMILYLTKEIDKNSKIDIPETLEDGIILWRELINKREVRPISKEYLSLENEFLKKYHLKNNKVSIKDCKQTKNEYIFTYHGSIINLKVDAIVNAANSEMIGCNIPNHKCIDNIIHTFAGYSLKLKCHELMIKQGHKEPIGKAKLTRGYNLPAKYIIHTVGPNISENKKISNIKKELLRQSYYSCLKLAKENNIKTLAFCCISTGEFGFDKKNAAIIAVKTVNDWLEKENYPLVVIFNTFTDEDKRIYADIFKEENFNE
ncbi:protein-ADP-ribose hydrolase [Oceanivirga salmonicida]|uniref:protein-ADP-ribose hydrolase n=1 Tax=Oceanivirga salmonicida TaxID=1769291 RepID=UPI000837563D|nr:protein-ADP-ribose hydrolase [Oceanivirga salmonicida]